MNGQAKRRAEELTGKPLYTEDATYLRDLVRDRLYYIALGVFPPQERESYMRANSDLIGALKVGIATVRRAGGCLHSDIEIAVCLLDGALCPSPALEELLRRYEALHESESGNEDPAV